MNAETRKVHDRLCRVKLPRGWSCEEAWPWKNGTHFVAPERAGGVIVRDRRVSIQLPGIGPSSPTVDVLDAMNVSGFGAFVGRGWLERLTKAATWAVGEYKRRVKTGLDHNDWVRFKVRS